MAGAAREGQPP
uniref:Uncharacterized protein n=1 Tax=Arundo donax TaxID=35708 RepID=A0A0A9C294_ARUDO